MNGKRYILLTALLLIAFSAGAQHAEAPQSKRFDIPLGTTVNLSEIEEDYMPMLQHMEAPTPDGQSERAKMMRIKEEISKKWPRQAPEAQKNDAADGGAPLPWMGVNFRSNNTINGVPNDNDMAISNDGMIVSVINSNIWVHDSAGTNLTTQSLDAWAASLGITGSKFDPRVLYDPIHDRFIIAALNGFTDSTSFLLVGFSQTNDPTGAWNLYALPGDPNNDTLWTDYPIMAITPYELVITVNLLRNGEPWQTGFAESIAWQLDLDSAYAGNTLASNLWFNINFGNAPVRNLCPVQGGRVPSGPNMYFVSNRNFAVQNDTVFFMEMTDTMNGPGVQFNVGYGLTDVQYGMAPLAIQQFSQQLATNDGRWLDAIIENDNIQYVGNCIDTTTGRAAIYHGFIEGISGTPTYRGEILSYPAGDYGYPGIAWCGMMPGSDEAMLTANYCGPDAQNHPGVGAIYYDGMGNYSDLSVAKTGQSWINAITGVDRWGDYSGAQLRYNETGVVWIAGTWGPANHLPATWVAEFHNPNIVSTEQPLPQKPQALVWPNPTAGLTAVEFRIEQEEFLDISLYDLTGQHVKTLVRDRVKAGKNRITFSTDPLAEGVYLLQIRAKDRTVATERVVKVH